MTIIKQSFNTFFDKLRVIINSSIYIYIEFIFLFILMPFFYYFQLIHEFIIFTLLIVTIYSLVIITIIDFKKISRIFKTIRIKSNRQNFINNFAVFLSHQLNFKPFKKELKLLLFRSVITAILIAAIVLIFERKYFLYFPINKTGLWILVCFLYPIFSALPQEIMYRFFFFRRYKLIFNSLQLRIILSAVTFAVVHILFHNWIAPVLSLFGGYIFAWTYSKHRSLFVVSVEHAIYGLLIFTLGLGLYFYKPMKTIKDPVFLDQKKGRLHNNVLPHNKKQQSERPFRIYLQIGGLKSFPVSPPIQFH